MHANNKNPTLLVFAGPNGSGKSTTTNFCDIAGQYINADIIKADLACSDIEAAETAENIREKFLTQRTNFTFETVLSTDRNLDLIARAKEVGYSVLIIFVITKNPEINVQRVKTRSKAGGHNVPVDKIRSRYYKTLGNIPKAKELANIFVVFDNSTSSPNLIFCCSKDKTMLYPNNLWSTTDIENLTSGRCIKVETQIEKFNNQTITTKETAIPEAEIPKMSVFDFCYLSGAEINRRMAAHFANREDVAIPESFVTIEKSTGRFINKYQDGSFEYLDI